MSTSAPGNIPIDAGSADPSSWGEPVPPGLLKVREAASGSHEVEPDLAGVVLSHYTLKSKIGRGAFGTVFRAEQDTPIRRVVAIKIAASSSFADHIAHRLEDEQRALASLNDPGIVRILDAGITPEGFPGGSERPYFVMEYVNGCPITDHAAYQNLDLRQRLELLASAMAAVSAAHKRGVIHRDLKPAHLLVDADGRVRLIDFGVSKAQGGDRAARTLTGGTPGTPRYMSPEQRGAGPNVVDTRSDVYALGIVLAELVLGDHGSTLDPHSLAEVPISELLPRGSARLRRACRAHVDWIVHKALAARPEERYQSVDDFRADLLRAVRGEPVAARPVSWWLSLKLLARRRPMAAGATAAFVLALTVGSIVVTALWLKNADLARIAKQREQAADLEACIARLSAAQTAIEFGSMDAAVEQLLQVPPPRRSWPWQHLLRSVQPAGRLLYKQEDVDLGRFVGLQSLSMVDDGARLAVGGTNGAVMLLDGDDGHVISRECVTGQVYSLCQSPVRGGPLAVGGSDGVLRLFLTEDLSESRLEIPLGVPIVRVVFSPDGATLAAGLLGSSVVNLIAVPTGELIGSVEARGHGVYGMAFAPDHRYLFVGTDQGRLETWDLQLGARIAESSVASDRLQTVRCSPDGSLLATATESGALVLLQLDGESGGLSVVSQTQRSHAIVEVDFAPDSSTLYTAGTDSMVRAWSVPDLRPVNGWRQHANHAYSVAVGRSGRSVFSCSLDGEVRELDPDGKDGPSDRVVLESRGVRWDPTGRFVFHMEGATGSVVDMQSGRSLYQVYFGSGTRPRWYELAMGALAGVDDAHHLSCIYLPDGRRLDFVPQGSMVHDRQPLAETPPRTHVCRLSPSLILMGQDGQNATIIDTSTGDRRVAPPELATLLDSRVENAFGGTRALFHASGRTLVFGSQNRIVSLAAERPIGATAIAFDNGKQLAILDQPGMPVEVFNLRDGSRITSVPMGSAKIAAMAISPDGSCIAVGRTQGSIDLVDLSSGRTLLTIPGADCPNSLGFDEEGSLWAASDSGVLRVWRTSLVDNPMARPGVH